MTTVALNLLVELAKPLLVEAVPDVDKTIRATCCQCVVLSVEIYSVHGVYLLHTIFFNPVALEGIFLFLHLWTGVQVLNRHTACKGTKQVGDVHVSITRQIQLAICG